MKKFLTIATITLMFAGVFSSNAQAEEYCEYDALGTVLQFTPPYLVGPNGSVDGVTFGAQAGWWNDDLMGCYEAFKAPSLLPILPRCDQDGNGVVDMDWLLGMYNFVLNFSPSASAFYHVPCVGGCYDLGSVDFMGGTGAAQPLGAAVIDGACAEISGNLVNQHVAPYVYADLAACEAACFGGSTGYECPADMPAYYDPAAVHDETSIEWTANGNCTELNGIDGPAACPQAQNEMMLGDLNYIIGAYPWTEAVFDGYHTGGQTWADMPYSLVCATDGSVAFPDGLFDDINGCYQGQSNYLASGSFVIIEFDWAVNVWDAVNRYDTVAKGFDPTTYCELDGIMGGAPTGFHASDMGSGWHEWTVRSTAECDMYGCGCDATLTLWSDGTQYIESALENNSGIVRPCNDDRFNF